jgi:alpha-amylase
MYFSLGQVTEFDFGQALGSAFKSGDLSGLASFTGGFFDTSHAVVFTDNHDTQRHNQAPLTYKDGTPYTLANVFMLGHPYGHPKVMSSFAFSDDDQGPPSTPVHSGSSGAVDCGNGRWVCEHRRPLIAAMVKFRKVARDSPVGNFQTGQSNQAVAFSRGSVGFVAVNLGSSGDWAATFRSDLPAGDYAELFTKAKVQVAADGSFQASVPAGGAFALLKE